MPRSLFAEPPRKQARASISENCAPLEPLCTPLQSSVPARPSAARHCVAVADVDGEESPLSFRTRGRRFKSCREQAVRSFLRQQLRPLLFRDDLSRYIRLFAWESAHPSKIFLKFMATNTTSYMTAAVDIVRKFLSPGADQRTALCAAIWLMGQCNVFVRNRELLAREPFGIVADEPFVEELTELVTRLALGGLLKANPI
jgi:hypothetical protein